MSPKKSADLARDPRESRSEAPEPAEERRAV
jgi:hypothetical protein